MAGQDQDRFFGLSIAFVLSAVLWLALIELAVGAAWEFAQLTAG
jgi:hypothetical protein